MKSMKNAAVETQTEAAQAQTGAGDRRPGSVGLTVFRLPPGSIRASRFTRVLPLHGGEGKSQATFGGFAVLRGPRHRGGKRDARRQCRRPASSARRLIGPVAALLPQISTQKRDSVILGVREDLAVLRQMAD